MDKYIVCNECDNFNMCSGDCIFREPLLKRLLEKNDIRAKKDNFCAYTILNKNNDCAFFEST